MTVKPFTDEDLKRLKAEVAKTRKQGDCLHILVPSIEALLSRLEAAENCMKEAYIETNKAIALYKLWRKACGK